MASYVSSAHGLREWPSLEDAQSAARSWVSTVRPTIASTTTVSIAIPIEHAKQQPDGSWCMEPIDEGEDFHSADDGFWIAEHTDHLMVYPTPTWADESREDAIKLRDWLTRVLR